MMGIRFGLMRNLGKICQDFNRAMPRSIGARAGEWPVEMRWVGVSNSPTGGGLSAVVTQGPAPW
jgi:hypothetical protein